MPHEQEHNYSHFMFNNGNGAVLCSRCRTMICSGIRPDQRIDQALFVHKMYSLTQEGDAVCSSCVEKISRGSASLKRS